MLFKAPDFKHTTQNVEIFKYEKMNLPFIKWTSPIQLAKKFCARLGITSQLLDVD